MLFFFLFFGISGDILDPSFDVSAAAGTTGITEGFLFIAPDGIHIFWMINKWVAVALIAIDDLVPIMFKTIYWISDMPR